MRPPIFKSAKQIITEQSERDPHFAEAYAEAHAQDDLGLTLAGRREQLGLTQREVAERAEMQQPMVARIERGAQNPTPATLQKLARALDCTIQIGADRITVQPNVTVQEDLVQSLTAIAQTAYAAMSEDWWMLAQQDTWRHEPDFVGELIAAVQSHRESEMLTTLYQRPSPLVGPTRQPLDDNSAAAIAAEVVTSPRPKFSPFMQQVA